MKLKITSKSLIICCSYYGCVDQFPGAGQNLAMSMTTGDPARNPDQIAKLAESWYNEQSNGGEYGWMDMINKFTTTGEG